LLRSACQVYVVKIDAHMSGKVIEIWVNPGGPQGTQGYSNFCEWLLRLFFTCMRGPGSENIRKGRYRRKRIV
jgi:hypothetical protein